MPVDEVHVWSASLNVSGAALCNSWDLLSPDEMRVAMEYRFAENRRQFVVTRALLRKLLSHYTGRSAAELCLDYDSSGKPVLRETQNLHFNVSHSRDLAVLAIARGLVGIDVEYVQTNFLLQTTIEEYLAGPERADLQALPANARVMAAYRCWTQKEAVLKALGVGLRYPPQHVSVPPDGKKFHLVSMLGRNWLIRQVSAPSGYAAAVAVEQPNCLLKWRQWSVHA